MNKLALTVFVSLLGIVASYSQKPDTIYVSPRDIDTKFLKEGTHQWLNYLRHGRDSGRKNFIFWTSIVKYIDHEGIPAISMKQVLENKDSAVMISHAVNDRKTFVPLFHESWLAPNRKVKVDFKNKQIALNDKLVTPDDTSQSRRRLLRVLDTVTSAYTLSWHVDLETFPLLTYRANRTFMINFHEPGSLGARVMPFTVTGSAFLLDANGEKVDCWLLVTKSKSSTQSFWIAKKSKEVLKLEEEFNGWIRYKIKLGFES